MPIAMKCCIRLAQLSSFFSILQLMFFFFFNFSWDESNSVWFVFMHVQVGKQIFMNKLLVTTRKSIKWVLLDACAAVQLCAWGRDFTLKKKKPIEMESKGYLWNWLQFIRCCQNQSNSMGYRIESNGETGLLCNHLTKVAYVVQNWNCG